MAMTPVSHSPPPAARHQSLGEEIANSVSHGLGLLAAIVATPFLISSAVRRGDAAFIAGASVFALSVLLLYGASMVYHALPRNRAKQVAQLLDHGAIFLLIAGTYTPFTLGVLRGGWGWSLFVIVWSIAAFGVTVKLLNRLKHPLVSTGLYLAMGWVVAVAAAPLVERIPAAGVVWLVAGGLSYTLGAVVFLFDNRVRYAHSIWHLFVLGGSACHFFAALWYGYSGAAPLAG